MGLTVYSDEYYMKLALQEAEIGYKNGEVPVGAVIVAYNHVIAKAHNQTQLLNDVTAHAEMIAITAAADYLGSKYLHACKLYVTLEPCVMCAGAMKWAQLQTLIYGAEDNKAGFSMMDTRILHKKTEVLYGICHEECTDLMKNFFKEKRKK